MVFWSAVALACDADATIGVINLLGFYFALSWRNPKAASSRRTPNNIHHLPGKQ